MVGGHGDPHRGVHEIHFEVVRSTGQPEFWVVPIEWGKLHLKELAEVGIGVRVVVGMAVETGIHGLKLMGLV